MTGRMTRVAVVCELGRPGGIKEAYDKALKLVRSGYAPYVVGMFGALALVHDERVEHEDFTEVDIAFVLSCDAVVGSISGRDRLWNEVWERTGQVVKRFLSVEACIDQMPPTVNEVTIDRRRMSS